MRARSFIRQILLLAAQAQVVVTDDVNPASAYPTKNFGSSIALLVGSGSNTYIKFSLASLGAGVTGSNVSKATLILYTDFVLTPAPWFSTPRRCEELWTQAKKKSVASREFLG